MRTQPDNTPAERTIRFLVGHKTTLFDCAAIAHQGGRARADTFNIEGEYFTFPVAAHDEQSLTAFLGGNFVIIEIEPFVTGDGIDLQDNRVIHNLPRNLAVCFKRFIQGSSPSKASCAA